MSFSSDGSGSFSSSGSCTLSGGSCQLTYTPSAVGSATHKITASYGGDATHATSSGTNRLAVSSTAVVPPPRPAPPKIHSVSEKVSGHSLTVKFKASGKASRFQCALVRVPTRKGAKTPAPKYAGCKSPKTYKNLKSGKYVLYVRAIGPGGTGSPATYKFKIK